MGFESFPTKKEKPKNESDEKLEKHKEDERLSIEPINDLLVELSEAENTEELIQLFNERAKAEDVEHLKGCLIETCQNTLLIIDKNGKLKEFACDSDSKLLELHKYIKEYGEHLKGNNTFLLADELFKRSKGTIDAYKFFVKDSTESMERGELFEYVNNPDNWIPLRAEMQEALLKLGIERGIKQSERLNDDVPTIHAYRGNTASGKSTMIRRDPSLAHALNEEGELDGALNPDIQKEQAQNWHMENGEPYGTTSQLHMEGGMISHKIKQDLLKRPELSLVMDQRFNTEGQISNLLKTAEHFKKEVRILDIECPLEVSLIRVLARSMNEPRPPFDAVTEGFAGIRESREKLIDLVKEHPNIKYYLLYDADETGNLTKLASMEDGEFTDTEKYNRDYERIAGKENKQEVVEMQNKIITDEYILKAKEKFALKYFQIKGLKRYIGKTFEQALNEHSTSLE